MVNVINQMKQNITANLVYRKLKEMNVAEVQIVELARQLSIPPEKLSSFLRVLAMFQKVDLSKPGIVKAVDE